MARCKLTNMNLRNIRKTREYQCLLIDLVKTGVVGKSAAEGLLGYTIPEGLLGDTTPVTPPDDEEEEPRLITIAAEVSDGQPRSMHIWDSFEYDLNNGDTIEDVLAAANEHWSDGDFDGNTFNYAGGLLENDEGPVAIGDKHYVAGPAFDAGDTIEPGMVVEVWYTEPLEEPIKPNDPRS